MLTRALTLIFATLLVLVMSHETDGAPLPGPLEVSMEVVVNPVDGSPRTGCQASETVETARQEWWIAFGHGKSHPQKGWEGIGHGIRCGSGFFEKGSLDITASPGAPYLIASVSTVAGLLPPRLIPDRVLHLDVMLSFKRLLGFGAQGEPVYGESVEKRAFFFLDGGEAFVPLLVATDAETKAFGIHEMFLRVEARRPGKESVAGYGVVSVISGNEGGEVLLDGGSVGSISAGAEMVLRNVPEGLREVRLRGSSGREVGKVVRVKANRTVLVEVSHPDPARNAASYRLAALGKNAAGYEEQRREADGAVVVKIPAGEFLMGNKETERSPLEHQVYVSEFLIDKTGVTWSQYKKFAEATGVPLPGQEPYWGIHDDHPAVFVTWEDAKAYCEWAGARLPTEAEREKAARGTDGRKYPWGNEEPDPQRGVYRRAWGKEATAAVGTHPAGVSPYGLLDMGGNVWEWCSDWYDDGYYAVSPYRDPKGPPSGTAHVLRGGSWDSRPTVLSASCRNWGHRGYREGDFGFRCAMNGPQDQKPQRPGDD
jgi:formylglycine-generating enzyme required for sulfatase activity